MTNLLAVVILVLCLAAIPVFPQDSASAGQISVDDMSSLVSYSSVGDWTPHANQSGNWSLFNNTDTFSGRQGAWMFFEFNGSQIEYWGNQGPFHGPCLVTLDDGTTQQVTSNLATNGVPITLFARSNLALNMTHWINITVLDSSFPNVCELDRFVYTPFESGMTMATQSSMQMATQSPMLMTPMTHPSTTSTTLVAVGAAIGAAIIAGVIVIIIFIQRQKARKRNLVTPLTTFDTKARKHDVDPDSESLVCEPPSPEESNLVAGWNRSRSVGRHRPFSGSSSTNVTRSDSGPQSYFSHVSRVPSTLKEKSESSEDITLPSPYPLISSDDQRSPSQMSQMPLQPLRKSASRFPPMDPSTHKSRSKDRQRSRSTSRSSSPYRSAPETPEAPRAPRAPKAPKAPQTPQLPPTTSTPPSHSGAAESTSFSPLSLYQHQDAGRVLPADPAELVLVREEIPPAYVDDWFAGI